MPTCAAMLVTSKEETLHLILVYTRHLFWNYFSSVMAAQRLFRIHFTFKDVLWNKGFTSLFFAKVATVVVESLAHWWKYCMYSYICRTNKKNAILVHAHNKKNSMVIWIDPSKVEAPLRRGGEGERSNNKSREDAWGKSTWGNELCKCDLHEAVYVYTWTQCDSSAVVIGGSPYLVPQCLTQTRKTSWLDTRVTNTAQSYFC